MEVLISTGDRDAFQLVGDQVTVLYPRAGVSDLARMDPAAVEAKYGVGPQHYRDLAALVGETSDNLPGVPGVGPKTAAKWINQYGGVDGVIAHADEIKGKAGDSLREQLADVIRNYEINCLVSDLELPLRPEDARWAGLGPRGGAPGLRHAASSASCATGSTSTWRRSSPRPSPASTSPARCSPSPARWPAGWPRTPRPARRSAWRSSSAPARAAGTRASSPAWRWPPPAAPAAWFDPAALDPADEAALAGWLADEQRPKVIHDSKPAVLAFAAHGWPLHGIARDTADRRLPGPPRPALLRPDRPGAALPAPRAAGRRAGDRPAHPRRARRRRA